MAIKNFVLDTNVIISSKDAIKTIMNGNDGGEANNIFIPYTVLEELDCLKMNTKLRPMVYEAFEQLKEYKDHIKFIGNREKKTPDNKILDEIRDAELELNLGDENTIFLTNDIMLQIKAEAEGINPQEFKDSKPYESESQQCDGFVNVDEGEKFFPNCFYWQDGRLMFNGVKEVHTVPDHAPWKITPKSYYQNAAIDLMKNDEINLVTIQSRAGLGKAQPLDAKILTPNGWKKMGDLQVGDMVINSQGEPTKVLTIHPQGEKEIYRVLFNDNSSTECCDDHLWFVRKEYHKYQVKKLRDIKDNLYNEKRKRLNWFIPTVSPIKFQKKPLPIKPYLMGVLLGDGGMTTSNVSITTVDKEIIDHCSDILPDGLYIKHICEHQYHINMLDRKIGGKKDIFTNIINKILYELKLFKLKSHEKFIPVDYLYSSIDDRVQILRGLMDTDSGILKDNRVEYHTSSSKLRDGVIFLVRSLGGRAYFNKKTPYYIYNGMKKQGKESYTVRITLPSDINPFFLKRKVNIYNGYKKYPPSRGIKEIKYIGNKEAQCITVDSDDHMYITDDFIVTHNSYISLATALEQTFEKKKYEKIYIFKNIVNIGQGLGFLPGSLEDKIEPYTRYMVSLIQKLSGVRKLSERIMDANGVINPHYIEILPLTFIRGMNIEDAFVIIDETQNISRQEMRALLTRMCGNVKVCCIGDTSQVDAMFLNEMNNALNWTVKLCKGQEHYGHITLKGNKSRGPITDMVLKVGL